MLFYALRSNLAVVIEAVHNIINGCECKCGAGICAAVVDADSSGVSVNEVSAGECNCVGITNELIVLLRAEEVGSTSLENLPRLVLRFWRDIVIKFLRKAELSIIKAGLYRVDIFPWLCHRAQVERGDDPVERRHLLFI